MISTIRVSFRFYPAGSILYLWKNYMALYWRFRDEADHLSLWPQTCVYPLPMVLDLLLIQPYPFLIQSYFFLILFYWLFILILCSCAGTIIDFGFFPFFPVFCQLCCLRLDKIESFFDDEFDIAQDFWFLRIQPCDEMLQKIFYQTNMKAFLDAQQGSQYKLDFHLNSIQQRLFFFLNDQRSLIQDCFIRPLQSHSYLLSLINQIILQLINCFKYVQFQYQLEVLICIPMEGTPINQDHQDHVSKEKLHALMIADYRNAIRILNQGSDQQSGHSILIKLINDQEIQEEGLQQLKYSALVSLAELSKKQSNIKAALFYWYQSTKIINDNNFTTWLKIAITMEDNFDQLKGSSEAACVRQWENQVQYAYKQAIKNSPLVWRERLLRKLLGIYQKHKKQLQIIDLKNVIGLGLSNNSLKFQELYLGKQKIPNNSLFQTRQHNQNQASKTLIIPLYLLLQSDNPLNCPFYWEYLLIISYVILKTKRTNDKGLLGSQILSAKGFKKHEEIIQTLMKIIDNQSQLQLKIKVSQAINLANQSNSMEQQPVVAVDKEDLKLHEFILDVLKYTTLKYAPVSVKAKKNAESTETNYLQQKLSHFYNHKNVLYQSIYDFYREVANTKGIDLGYLAGFKHLDLTDNQTYESMFGGMVQNLGVEKPKRIKKAANIVNNGQNTPSSKTRHKQIFSETKKQEIPIDLETPKKKTEEIQIQIETLLKSSCQQYFKSKQKDNVLETNSFSSLVEDIIHTIFKRVIDIIASYQTYSSGSIRFIFDDYPCFAIFFGKCLILAQEQSNFIQVRIKQQCLRYRLNLQEFVAEYIDFLILRDNQNQNSAYEVNYHALESIIGIFGGKTVDQIILSNQKGFKGPINSKYQIDTIYEILQKIRILSKVYTLPHLRNEKKITKYLAIYDHFYPYLASADHPQYKTSLLTPSSFSKLTQNQINRSRLRQLAQQSEESVLSSIDKILKSDIETNEAIDSIKILLENQETQPNSPQHLTFFLKSFIKVIEILLNKIKSASEFPKKFISSVIKALNIPSYIDVLYKKLTADIAITEETLEKNNVLLISCFFSLLKVILMNQLDSEHTAICLRIIFFLYEELIKKIKEKYLTRNGEGYENNPISIDLESNEQNSNQINSLGICEVIIFIESLIKMKESADLRKKFYQRVLVKTISIVYDSRYSSLAPNTSENNEEESIEIKEIRHKVYQIYNDAYQSKSFKPKKIEECIGYFTMIGNQFAQDLEKPEVDIQPKMKRILNECYLSFSSQYEQYMQYCEKFMKFIKVFIRTMNREIKVSSEFIQKAGGQVAICECCQLGYLQQRGARKTKIPKQILFVIGKYLQNRNNTDSKKKDVEVLLGAEDFCCEYSNDERYYMDYLILDIKNLKAWRQILRIQITKIYEYFDALIGIVETDPQKNKLQYTKLPNQQGQNAEQDNKQGLYVTPLQLFKHKFLYAKTLANFITKSLIPYIESKKQRKQIQEIQEFIEYRMCLINAIKISERKLYRLYTNFMAVKDSNTDNDKKYIEGIIKILQNIITSNSNVQTNQGSLLIEVKIIELVEFEYPLLFDYFSVDCHAQKIDTKKDILPDPKNRVQYFRQVTERTLGLISLVISRRDSLEKISKKKSSEKQEMRYLQVQMITDFLVMLAELIMKIFDYIELFSESPQKCENGDEQAATYKIEQFIQVDRVLDAILIEYSEMRWVVFLQSQNLMEQQNNPIKFLSKFSYPDYLPTLTNLENKLIRITKILRSVRQQEDKLNLFTFEMSKSKKSVYSRYVYLASICISKIELKLGSESNSFDNIKDLMTLKNDDLIHFYHHYQKESTQNNEILAEFYNRAIVFHYRKIEGIELILRVLSTRESLEQFILYLRKIGKMYTQVAEKQEDPKKSKKPQPTANIKQAESNREKSNTENLDKKDNKKKRSKDKKEKKNQRKIRWLYILFLRGFQIYLQALRQKQKIKPGEPFQEKYGRAVVEFKNKIKKEIDKEKKNPSTEIANPEKTFALFIVEDCEKFIAEYERLHKATLKTKIIKKNEEKKNADIDQQAPKNKNNTDPDVPLIKEENQEQGEDSSREEKDQGKKLIIKQEDNIGEENQQNQENEMEQQVRGVPEEQIDDRQL